MRSFLPLPVDHELAATLARELGVHAVTAQVLVLRGLADAGAAREFLRPGPAQLHDPDRFQDMDLALGRLVAAISTGARIAVYGDYDVDGVSATALLTRTLRFLGADVLPFIPDRMREGFGLNAEALLRLREQGCALVVTVDNGTSRADEIAAAQDHGLRVIVTDHHEQGTRLPDCPVINPKRRDSSYPFSGLAGCGVAFKLATALAERMGRAQTEAFRRLLPDLLALVAIGTVADVVPLRDENRSLVALGLKALQATRHPGLRALLEVSRCSRRPPNTTDIAYRVGPRINAAGRLGSAHLALDLLLCEEEERGARLAAELDEGNLRRQQIDREQAEEAFRRAQDILQERDLPALVLSDPDWHPGVIGIVAARVAESYRRPAVLIAVEGEAARGSARSFGHVQLHKALEDCSAQLVTHGGHAAAAGFTMRSEQIGAFTEQFLEAVRRQGPGQQAARRVDAELPLEAITAPLAAELESLQPFGAGNREPLFCAYGLRTAGKPRCSGQGERHLTFFAASQDTSVRAVAFNQADQRETLDGRFDLAFVLRRREGPDGVELVVREIVPAGSN